MAIYVVEVTDVAVELAGHQATITIRLPSDYRTTHIDSLKARRKLEKFHSDDPSWIGDQIRSILSTGKGVLADSKHPMRSPGAGVLPTISIGPGDVSSIMHIRGSNRGQVWPVGVDIPHVFGWKEFAGITGSADELEDPRRTAIMELYEELSLVAADKMLLPDDIGQYPEVHSQLDVAIERVNRFYDFNLSCANGHYEPVTPEKLDGDQNTTVEIVTPTGQKTTFNAIVNYDPFTNALETSFVTNLMIRAPLTGILSLAGPEDRDMNSEPYMEDIVVATLADLRRARIGREINALHLLSVHGPANYARAIPARMNFTPTPTLEPIVAFLKREYSFRSVLEIAYEKVASS